MAELHEELPSLDELFQVKESVTLSQPHEGGTSHPTQVVKVSPGEIFVAKPAGWRGEVGEPVTLSLRIGSDIYVLETAVAGIKDGEIQIVKGGALQRVQRRRFFRVPLSGRIRLTILEWPDGGWFRSEERSSGSVGPWPGRPSGRTAITAEGFLKEISAGGMALETSQPLQEKCLLSIRFDLPSLPLQEVKGRVVWVTQRGLGYHAGVKFVGVSEGEEDAMVRFVFHRQVELRRLGLKV